MLFIGKATVAEIIAENDKPLTYAYYRDVKKGLAPKNAPTYISKSKLVKEEKTSSFSKYRCPECGYIYNPKKGDPDSGTKPGTPFEDIPDDWICPVCGTEKKDFVKMDKD